MEWALEWKMGGIDLRASDGARHVAPVLLLAARIDRYHHRHHHGKEAYNSQ